VFLDLATIGTTNQITGAECVAVQERLLHPVFAHGIDKLGFKVEAGRLHEGCVAANQGNSRAQRTILSTQRSCKNVPGSSRLETPDTVKVRELE